METIIHIPNNLYKKDSGSENLNFLLHYPKTYIMDNHLAAGWGWLQELDSKESYCFFHIDQHDDLCDGGNYDLFVHLKGNPHISIEDYTNLEFCREQFKYKVFRWDNYIRQIQYLFPQWFSESSFACHERVCDKHPLLNIHYNPTPFELYDNIEYWVGRESKDFIFNLDIDYFFSKGMCIFSDGYIKSFAQELNRAMRKIAVLTIALSPECCGGWANSIRVFNILAEELDVIDENPFV